MKNTRQVTFKIPLLTLTFLCCTALALRAQTTWTGSINTDWHNPSNWTAGIPDQNDVVTITDQSNDPTISVTATVKAIRIDFGGKLTIAAGGLLNIPGGNSNNDLLELINGSVTNNGLIRIGLSQKVANTGIRINSGSTFTNNGAGVIDIQKISVSVDNNGTFNNRGVLSIWETGYAFEFYVSGKLLNTGKVTIDDYTNFGLRNNTTGTSIVNQGEITVGAPSDGKGDALSNFGTVHNTACATFRCASSITNGATIINDGLFSVNTTNKHSVFQTPVFTNNGILEYPQGNPMSNVTNNEIIILLKTNDCTSIFTNALNLGSPLNFSIATTWYYDANLTQPAGAYNLATNTFTANSGFPINADQTVYYSITDPANGCTRTASQTLRAKDDFAPVFTAVPGSGTVECNNIPPVGTPIAVDNCGGPVIITYLGEVETPGTCPVVRTLTRRWQATDQAGNAATGTQIITVRDQKPPAFSGLPANTTVECGGVPALASPTASDNCAGPVTITYLGETSAPGACPVLYILTRSWRASDACGNAAIASQLITVRDTKSPVLQAKAQNQVPECSPDNAAQLQSWLNSNGGASATDCSGLSWSYTNTPGNFDLKSCGTGFKKYIRFIATDQCGNTAYTDASFITVDNTAPVFVKAPEDQSVNCMIDCNGEPDLYNWLDNNAYLDVSDNCGTVKLERYGAGSGKGCANTWWKRYEFRATDACGNVSKAYATFSVVDNEPPTVVCPENMFIQTCIDDLPQPDPASISAVDNCTVSCSVTVDASISGSGCVGDPLFANYTYTATDECGNRATCYQQIQVRDNTASDLLMPDKIQVDCVDDIPGPDAVGQYIANLAGGNCKAKNVTLLSDSGPNGLTRTYSLQGRDQCNNLSAVFSVTFEATGSCKPLCTATIADWADAGAGIGSESTKSVLDSVSSWFGGVSAGSLGRTLTIAGSDCFESLVVAFSGDLSLIPYGKHVANDANGCALDNALLGPGGALRSELLANILSLQLNILYNRHFNQRDLGVQDLRTLPACMIDDVIMTNLGTNATWQDLLNHANAFLGNQGPYYDLPEYAEWLNTALTNLNILYRDCIEIVPCQVIVKPAKGRNENGTAGIEALTLFPNPATDGATLQFTAANASNQVEIRIIGAAGTVSRQYVDVASGVNAVRLPLAGLADGVYTLALNIDGAVQTLRFVKLNK